MLWQKLLGATALVDNSWNISTASYLQNFSVSAQQTNPSGLFFKPDGTKMYICGNLGINVGEYDLTTAWDITTASFVQNFDVSSQLLNPRGIFFKSDGTKMYVVGTSSTVVAEYDLSSAWNVSTASFLRNFGVSSQDSNPQDVFFKSDGTKMYMVGSTNDNVYEYNLSSAWNVSTLSYLQSFSVGAQDTSPFGLFLKPDGTKMYTTGSQNDSVYEYNLSSTWDISSSSYLQSFSVSSQDATPQAISFNSDGTKMYMVGSANDNVYEYDIG
jgi:DNA-binding beta-propeller fold protein YncE